MIIGHAPAGYIISTYLFPHLSPAASVSRRTFLFAGVAGAVAPDIDMLYFHLVDHRQHLHHSYFTHFPSFWATLLVLAFAWLVAARAKAGPLVLLVFFLNAFVHMVLDTIVGGIEWMAPLNSASFSFATVSPRFQPWWLNFFLHWSFLLEIALVLWAIVRWRQTEWPRPLPRHHAAIEDNQSARRQRGEPGHE